MSGRVGGAVHAEGRGGGGETAGGGGNGGGPGPPVGARPRAAEGVPLELLGLRGSSVSGQKAKTAPVVRAREQRLP